MKHLSNPLNGNTGRQQQIANMLKVLNPDLILETGTFVGATTRWLKRQVPTATILSIESNKEFFDNLPDSGDIIYIKGRSEDIVPGLGRMLEGKTVFAYLDAHLDLHGGEPLPLMEELLFLTEHIHKGVIVIDDCQVPGDDGYEFLGKPLPADHEREWLKYGQKDYDGPPITQEYVKQYCRDWTIGGPIISSKNETAPPTGWCFLTSPNI